MATTIVTKSGSGAPTASDLVAGELAVDLTNGRLYTEDSGGTVLELGLNPSGNVDVTGTVTATGTSVFASLDISGDIDVDGTTNLDVVDIDGAVDFGSTTAHAGNATFADNAKAIFGAESDLQIYHDGSNSYITEGGTGNLQIQGQNLSLEDSTGMRFFLGIQGGETRLYNQGNEKVAVTSTGIDITGTATADGLTVNGDSISFNTTAGDLDINPLGGGSVEIESSGTLGVKVGGTSGFSVTDASDNNIFKAALNGDISFYEDTGTTPKFFWDASAESLGIGTSSPASLMHLKVAGAGGTNVLSLENDSNKYDFRLTSADLVIRDGSSDRVTLDSSGRVGIGTSSPSVAMHSVGKVRAQKSGQSNAYVQLSADELTSNYAADIFLNDTGLTFKHNSGSRGFVFDQNGSEAMRIDASRNLLVGATENAIGNAGFKISGVGFARVERTGTTSQNHLSFTNENGDVGSISTSGSATAYNTSSDQRLKENIVDADDAGSKIDAIQVRKFDWKVDGSHQDYGMVAQELQSVAPEAVSVPEDPEEMMAVDYSKLVPMMLKEIQSLRARIAALES